MSTLRLELDWASETEPAPVGVDMSEGRPTGIIVTEGKAVGPAGWPTIEIHVAGSHWRDYALLESWLRNVYLVGLEEPELSLQSNELANMAEEV